MRIRPQCNNFVPQSGFILAHVVVVDIGVNITPRSVQFSSLQARFACLRCEAGGHKVFARGIFSAPGLTLINYKVDNPYY